MIAIVDYEMGNVGSIANMLRRIGAVAEITSDGETLAQAAAIILPGVGAFDQGMQNLKQKGLITCLTDLVLDRHKPLLGICLGMQLLTRRSDEGERPGLGWFAAETRRLRPQDPALRIPHMGWNVVKPARVHYLWRDAPAENRFYFVHSYHVVCDDAADILSETQYGEWFTSGIARENIIGLQFHPEKSHKYGMRVLKNFVEQLRESEQ